MNTDINVNDIALREKKLYHLKCELEKRKKIMIEKGKKLKKHTNENEFLKIILEDYNKYYNYIIDIKKKQLDQFNQLKHYLANVKSNIQSIDINMDRAKLDYKDINNEINKIKGELNQIISNSNINE